jgi:hypothetical protein
MRPTVLNRASLSLPAVVMNELEDTAEETPEARSRRLHEEFEAYYAEWERHRLGQEAFARRLMHAASDPRA